MQTRKVCSCVVIASSSIRDIVERSDQMDLGLEPDTVGCLHPRLDLTDEGHVVGRRAAGSVTMKLACFSETRAPPSRRPFNPAASMSRAA